MTDPCTDAEPTSGPARPDAAAAPPAAADAAPAKAAAALMWDGAGGPATIPVERGDDGRIVADVPLALVGAWLHLSPNDIVRPADHPEDAAAYPTAEPQLFDLHPRAQAAIFAVRFDARTVFARISLEEFVDPPVEGATVHWGSWSGIDPELVEASAGDARLAGQVFLRLRRHGIEIPAHTAPWPDGSLRAAVEAWTPLSAHRRLGLRREATRRLRTLS